CLFSHILFCVYDTARTEIYTLSLHDALPICETYRYNVAHHDDCSSVICADVKDVNIKSLEPIDIFAYGFPCNDFSVVGERKGFRSEEHTSELQSRENLVCRLLLEKKK